MKNIIFILFLVTSCGTSNFQEVVYHDFGMTKHWVVNYSDPETSKEDMAERAKMYASPENTTYFYFYPASIDVSILQNANDQTGLIKLMTEDGPTASFVVAPQQEPMEMELSKGY